MATLTKTNVLRTVEGGMKAVYFDVTAPANDDVILTGLRNVKAVTFAPSAQPDAAYNAVGVVLNQNAAGTTVRGTVRVKVRGTAPALRCRAVGY